MTEKEPCVVEDQLLSGVEPSAYARARLWPLVGGEKIVVGFIEEITKMNGVVYLAGGAARVTVAATLGLAQAPGDVDFIVCGLDDLGRLRAIAERVWGKEPDYLIGGERQPDAVAATTVQVIKRPRYDQGKRVAPGQSVADLVLVRGENNQPDPKATIRGHLISRGDPTYNRMAYCLEVMDDRVVLGELIDPCEGRRDLEGLMTKTTAEKISAGNALRIFRFLVITGENEEEITKLAEFLAENSEALVVYRYSGETESAWLVRAEKLTSKARKTGLGATRARRFNRIKPEEVVRELAKAFQKNPQRAWDIGMKTGLLAVLFPVLGCLSEKERQAIDTNIANIEAGCANQKWFEAVFKPIYQAPGEGVTAKVLEQLAFYLRPRNPNAVLRYIAGKQPHPDLHVWAMANFLPLELVGIHTKELTKRLGD
ncbi:hypothetical protein FJZ40_00965 [Candidatus Shapirobacteria bacterium]|nr:hypothetical protein [Candidatus Shapirobacteria bacterium]